MPYVMTSKLAGDEISSTYEGRHIDCQESDLVHPSHTDGFVNNGDPVLMGENVVGVAFSDASAATNIIAVDTEGIWALSVVATNQYGNVAVARGDVLFINKTTAIISKNYDKNVSVRFGVALSTLGSGTTGIVAVKVHMMPDDEVEQVGSSSAYFNLGTTANIYARQYRYTSAATTGAVQGIYNRLVMTAAGTATSNSLRSYTEVLALIGNAYGAHISLGFGESTTCGGVTGLGAAVRATLGIPDGAVLGGTICGVMAEIFSFGANSSVVGTRSSFIMVANSGNTTGIGIVEHNSFLFDFSGFTVDNSHVFAAGTTEANYAYCARCYLAGVGNVYLMFASAIG